jgi:hypothetical protein
MGFHHHSGRGVAPSPESRGITLLPEKSTRQIHVRLLAARYCPRFCLSLSLTNEGAGNAGCALHPRSRVRNRAKKLHTSIQGSGEHPTFPAQWFDGLSRAHPGVSGSSRLRRLRIAGSSAPGRADLPSADLTPTIEASGPHDFAVRFDTARLHVPKAAHGVYPALQSHSAHDAAASTAIPSQRS